MKNYQSKFSNKKASSGTDKQKGSSTVSGCCCGSHFSEEVEDIEISNTEEK